MAVQWYIDWVAGVTMLVLAVIVALALGAAVARLVERLCARSRPGCCGRCGYNLTGLPEPRCPECGQQFEPKADAP